MTDTIDTPAAASAGSGPARAGAKLRAAREAAGLSVDAVAHQLKLAPRQVTALEDDDYQRLPGRTFVRGFARNYARFLRLDAESVLALLPAGETVPALERPPLTPSRRPMGEIPVERVGKPAALRWILPLALVAAITLAAFYEFGRAPIGRWLGAHAPSKPAENAAALPATEREAASSPASSAPRTLTTTLPNPVAESATSTSPAERSEATTPGGGTSAAPGTPSSSTSVPSAAAETSLVLTFKGTSWAEVRDANGRVVLQMTGGAGMTQTVSGTPPLELALGNAPEVGVTYRGQALDLMPYTRGTVARVALK